MGLDVGAIGAAAGGFSQGIGQGFDLVNRYQEIQDNNERRRKQQQVEQVGMQIAKDGLFQKDPDKALAMMRDAFVGVGELDKAQQYQQQLEANKSARQKKTALEAFQYLKIDPQETINRLNQLNNERGVPTQYTLGRNPDGTATLSGTRNGEKFTQPYANSEELLGDLAEQVRGFVMSPEEILKFDQEQERLEIDKARSQSVIDENRSSIAEREALLPFKKQNYQAETAASQASAGASGAIAEARRYEISESKRTQAQRDEAAAAGLEQTKAETEKARKGAIDTGGKDLSELIDKTIPEPLMNREPEPQNDKVRIGELAESMRTEKGDSGPAAIAKARDILRKATPDNTEVDVAGGAVRIDGRVYEIGSTAAEALQRQLTSGE